MRYPTQATQWRDDQAAAPAHAPVRYGSWGPEPPEHRATRAMAAAIEGRLNRAGVHECLARHAALRRARGAARHEHVRHRRAGTCDNLLTIKRPFVEACLLNDLRNHLMDPARTELFCREFARHLNEARLERSAAKQGYRSELDG